jgi:FemAB-related protein (PEP-CTERM system-associated)
MMNARVKMLEVDGFYAWDRFVMEADQGTLFHLTRWQDVIRVNFKHRPFYLYRERDGEITGILPLVLVRSSFLGSVLVSTPYAVYGGIVAREDGDAARLLDAARDLGGRLGVRYVELRSLFENNLDLPSSDLYNTFIREIPEKEEDCLTCIPRKSRASARQGRDKHNLRFIEANHRLDRFYDLFVANKRQLGSPVFSRKYFRSLMDIFDGRIFIHCVLREDRILSAVMSFVHKDTVLPYYSGAETGSEAYQCNNFQYWQLMVWAGRRGLRNFDFGRSRNETGAMRFKVNMGFTPRRLNYQFYFPREGRIPNLNPSNPKLDLPKQIMQRIPISLAKLLGPLLVRHIP